MSRLLCVMTVAVAAMLFAAPVSALPVVWPVNGHAYEFVAAAPMTWCQARGAATVRTYGADHGYLATLTSAEENQFVRDNVLPSQSNDKSLWAGGFQHPNGIEPSQGWGWITGESWVYTSWYPGEPNESTSPSCQSDYLNISLNPPTYGGWNDACFDDGSIIGYVVEYGGAGDSGGLVECQSPAYGVPALTNWGRAVLALCLCLGGALALVRRRARMPR